MRFCHLNQQIDVYFVLFYHFWYSSLHWLIQGTRKCWYDFTVNFDHREIFCFLSVVVRFWNSCHWCSTCHAFPSSVRHLHPHHRFLLAENSLLLILGMVGWHEMTNPSGEGWVLLALYGIKGFKSHCMLLTRLFYFYCDCNVFQMWALLWSKSQDKEDTWNQARLLWPEHTENSFSQLWQKHEVVLLMRCLLGLSG